MKEHYEHIPCSEDTPCKLRDIGGCFEDIHHEAHPRSEYRTALEKRFREHVMNKVLMCRAIHNDIHANNLVPVKPNPQEMRKLIEHNEKTSRSSRIGNRALDGQAITPPTTD